MKYLLAAAIVAVGFSGLSASSAMADKTSSSDPAPKTTAASRPAPTGTGALDDRSHRDMHRNK